MSKFGYPMSLAIVAFSLSFNSLNANADIPDGYYDSANNANAAALRNSLHAIIDDHQRFPYTSSSTDTWDILESADQNPSNAAEIITIYRNIAFAKEGGGNSNYNREHSWPRSYGFPDDDFDENYPFTDTHHLFLADANYNSERGNKPFNECDLDCTEYTTVENNGQGGSGFSNWTKGEFTDGDWETWSERKGDIARALLYMDVRYEGGTHGETGHSEPDLILTNDRSLIDSANTGNNESVAYMGMLDVLLEWHESDPVDDFERNRNDVIYSHQGNRNPFIDHPEYVACVFNGLCDGGSQDTTPPEAPTGLNATAERGAIALTWTANSETDLVGYHVYTSDSSNGSFSRANSELITATEYTLQGLGDSQTVFIQIVALDDSSNESAASETVEATTLEGITPDNNQVWINELHYDNNGTDENEFVEIASLADVNLAGWTLVFYNGSNGETYLSHALSGIIAEQDNGFGTLAFDIAGIQNGEPDGIALVNPSNQVIQFISYEGAFEAVNGVAADLMSTDIGVSESSSTDAASSLSLAGTGSTFEDFTWEVTAENTKGAVNQNQSFETQVANQAPVADFSFSANDLTVTFTDNSQDPESALAEWSWDFGDGNQSNEQNPTHTYQAAGTYSASLTVTDAGGLSHSISLSVTVTAPTPPTPTPDTGGGSGGGSLGFFAFVLIGLRLIVVKLR